MYSENIQNVYVYIHIHIIIYTVFLLRKFKTVFSIYNNKKEKKEVTILIIIYNFQYNIVYKCIYIYIYYYIGYVQKGKR